MRKLCPYALMAATGALLLTATPLQASDADDRIESSVKKSYVFKTYLKDDSIKTVSKNGAVTLTGNVANGYHKSLAQDTVEGMAGVKSVDNRLTVGTEKHAEYSDGWLSTKVKTSLLFHRNVSGSGTDVYVKDGIVSLRGEASSLAQKELTAEYAGDVEGIKGVKNEMTVAKTPPTPTDAIGDSIDDASITAQVKASLMTHRSTSALKTRVETADGVVTVSGVAKNAAERSLVSKLVNDINGVNKVINNMTIAVPVASN